MNLMTEVENYSLDSFQTSEGEQTNDKLLNMPMKMQIKATIIHQKNKRLISFGESVEKLVLSNMLE